MIFFSSSDDLTCLLYQATRAGSPIAVLVPAIGAGLTVGVMNKRDAPVSMPQLRAIVGPVLALLGDDDYATTGPTKWISAPNLLRWADAVVIHGAAGIDDHYREIASGALAIGRVLMVETSSAFLIPWLDAAGDKVRLVIAPFDGHHPIVPSRGDMN